MSIRMEDLRADIDELHKLMETAKRPKVKDVLSIEVRKMETTLVLLNQGAEFRAASAAAAGKPLNGPKQIPTEKIRNYAWGQSDKFVKLYLTIPGVHNLDENLISSTFIETGFSLTISTPGKISTFNVDKLLHHIVAEESHHKVKVDNVVIFLKKKNDNKWSFLTTTEKEISEARDSKYSKEKLDDPSGGVMSLMKKIYEEGDDETKRTLAKAWEKAQKDGPCDL